MSHHAHGDTAKGDVPTVRTAGSSWSDRLRSLAAIGLVLTLILILPSGPGPCNTLSAIFSSIILEALPFMLFGALIGGVIEAFVSRERMTGLLPRNPLATVCVAAAMGCIFPVCECAVVPVVRRLIGKGLPFSAAIAYLLAGPIVNPIVAASTWLAYGMDTRVAALRVGLGYVIAVAVAVIMGRVFPGRTALLDDAHPVPAPACACGCGDIGALPRFSEVGDVLQRSTFGFRCMQALRHGAADFLGVGQYLIIGAFIAALAQTFVNRSLLLEMHALPITSVLLMSGLAVLLNLCSEADAFIAASFRGLLPMPAQMAFMLTGPMFDLKLLLMYQVLFRRRAITLLSVLILVFTLAGALCLGWSRP